MRCPGSRGLGGMARYDQRAHLRAAGGALERDRRRAWAPPASRAACARALMVRPTPEFFLLMFALFKLGAVPVLVDPGIPRAALKTCLAEAEPEAFIGIPLAQAARTLLGWAPRATLRGHRRPALVLGRRDAGRGRAAEWRARATPSGAPCAGAGGHRRRRSRRDPVHLRLDRPAQGRGVPASAFHRADRNAARGLRHAGRAAWTCRPFRPSRCSIPRWA